MEKDAKLITIGPTSIRDSRVSKFYHYARRIIGELEELLFMLYLYEK